MEWISVCDRMPEEGAFVLVYYSSGDYMLAGYYDGEWTCDSPEGVVVTHWMPLPPKPSGGVPA